MTPDEYERRPEVKAALDLIRGHRRLLAGRGSWATFKLHLMEILGVPHERFTEWDVPTELIYAQKRVGAVGERGWTKKDAFAQVVVPAIKAGRLRLE